MTTTLTLTLAGPVLLIGPDGADHTPRGMKARGLLAALGTARALRLPRSRLQDLLYSDRGAGQGAASMRQLLREVRVALDGHRDVLITGPGWAGLDPAALRVDVEPRRGVDGQLCEFAADLDINDPEFEDWLRDARQAYLARAEQSERADPGVVAAPVEVTPALSAGLPSLTVSAVQSADPGSGMVAEMVLMESVSRASDLTPLAVFDQTSGGGAGGSMNGASAGGGAGITLQASAAQFGAQALMNVALIHDASRRIIWSKRFEFRTGHMSHDMHRGAEQIALAIMQAAENSSAAALQQRIPLSDLFSFSARRLDHAEGSLLQAQDALNPGVGLALRSFIRTTQLLERLTDDPLRILSEATELARKAREVAPGSATALAVGALIASYDRRFDVEMRLATQAMKVDPLNPMALLAHSQALNDVGRHREAGEQARKGIDNVMSQVAPATWLLRQAIASFRLGDYAAAERHFEATHAHAPENRPALRFLAALRFNRGDRAGASRALMQLKALEPDFTLDLMASDDYPVASLRQANMLGITKSGLL